MGPSAVLSTGFLFHLFTGGFSPTKYDPEEIDFEHMQLPLPNARGVTSDASWRAALAK